MLAIHRILGFTLSILCLVWFLSGLVMIYHTFPRADRADKRAKMDLLSVDDLPSLQIIEKRIPEGETIKTLHSTAIWDRQFFIYAQIKEVMTYLPILQKHYQSSTASVLRKPPPFGALLLS